jgi:predicted DCC family thiol-disulfide oxidoreductase YuxK
MFYDADCEFCLRQVARLQRWLGPGRIQYSPLQSPNAAEILGLSPSELFSQMHYLRSDGRCFSGADALLELGRLLWWVRPLAWVGRMPGIVCGLRWAYRKVAAHRYCLASARSVNKARENKSRRVFFDLP